MADDERDVQGAREARAADNVLNARFAQKVCVGVAIVGLLVVSSGDRPIGGVAIALAGITFLVMEYIKGKYGTD